MALIIIDKGREVDLEKTKAFRTLLKNQTMTVSQIARGAGITRQTVHNILNGAIPSKLSVKKICKYLQVNWKDYYIVNKKKGTQVI